MTDMLLNLELLELLEAGSARLQMQRCSCAVEAAVGGGAGGGRREVQRAHRLVRLRTTRSACVRRHYQQRFHLRAPRHDA
jgi:hypothetical protein